MAVLLEMFGSKDISEIRLRFQVCHMEVYHFHGVFQAQGDEEKPFGALTHVGEEHDVVPICEE